MIYSSDLILQLQANDPKTDWRVAPIHPRTATAQPETYGGGSALAIPSTAAHPKEAMDFMHVADQRRWPEAEVRRDARI